MSGMLIDPPVWPGSPRADLEAWVAKLEGMRVQHADDAAAVVSIDQALTQARRWLGASSR